VLALAACLLLALGLTRPLRSWLTARKPPTTPTPVEVARDQPPAEAVPMSDHLAAASSAIASLTKRTTDQAVEPTRKLLPDQVEAPSLNVADRLPRAIDPAAQSLQEVRQGAAAGLEPVTSSARRAFSMFRREFATEPDRKRDF